MHPEQVHAVERVEDGTATIVIRDSWLIVYTIGICILYRFQKGLRKIVIVNYLIAILFLSVALIATYIVGYQRVEAAAADDTAILATGEHIEVATYKMQLKTSTNLWKDGQCN